jgi:hypothetical protein
MFSALNKFPHKGNSTLSLNSSLSSSQDSASIQNKNSFNKNNSRKCTVSTKNHFSDNIPGLFEIHEDPFDNRPILKPQSFSNKNMYSFLKTSLRELTTLLI